MPGVKATRTAHRSKDSRQRNHGSDSHEEPGQTSKAAAAARLTRIEDVRSGTAEQEDCATHQSTSSAQEKSTKVNVDDEGRSGVRTGNDLTPGVEKESRP